MKEEVLYYESHITIEPIFDERLEMFEKFCRVFAFTPAKLFMQKERDETPERSNKDTFCTSKSTNKQELIERMNNLIGLLREFGYIVWRYKIEAVIVDEKRPRKKREEV